MKLMPKTACDISYAYDAKGRLASAVPVYHYYLQDHLGNNRVVVSFASLSTSDEGPLME